MRGFGYRRTGDASPSFLCLAASVGGYPAVSGIEGSPGRDRASSFAQFWDKRAVVMTSCCVVTSSIDLNVSSEGDLNVFGDRPGKARQFSSNRGGDHSG